MENERDKFLVLRKSTDLVFRDMDDDLLKEFLVFSNKYARGNKLYALRILLYNSKDSLIGRVEKLERLLEEMTTEPEKPKRELPKTMGGNKDE